MSMDIPLPTNTGPATASTPRRRGTGILGRRGVRIALGFVLPVLLLAIWFVLTAPGANGTPIVPPYQFPSPAGVVQSGISLAERGVLLPFIGISFQRVLIGFAVGAILGIILGGLVGLSRLWDALLDPTLGIIRAVPSLAWVPLLIVWFSIGEESKVILIAIGAFFPVFTTVSLALRHVDPHLVEVGRTFGLRGIRLFLSVQIPAVLPSLFAGLRLALVQAWLFLVAAELLGASMGLGYLLLQGQNNGRVDQIVLAIILLAIFGKLSDAALGLVQRWATNRWG